MRAKSTPGVEKYSRTLLSSTIVVRDLIDCVRDGGDVSFKPAIDTGKNMEQGVRKYFCFRIFFFEFNRR